MHKIQTAFVAGELSPAMFGRIDDAKYQQGLSKCRNFIPLPQGPLVNRPGFAYVAETKYNKPTRLIPFQFSATQTMVVELGDKYARFITQGKTLLNAEGTAPYEIETPYLAEHLEELRYVQAGDVMTIVHVEYPPMELRRYGPTDWRLVPVSFGVDRKAPKNVRAEFTVVNKPNYDLKDTEKFRYTYKYKVTAVYDAEVGGSTNSESFASEEATVKGNLYLDNALVEITWDAVPGAKYYRVYKSHKGVFGTIGETEDLKFADDNFKGEHDHTPPIYDDPFSVSKGVTKVEVLDGGEGYDIGAGIAFDTNKFGGKREYYGIVSSDEITSTHEYSAGDITLYRGYTHTVGLVGGFYVPEGNLSDYGGGYHNSLFGAFRGGYIDHVPVKTELGTSTTLVKVVDRAGKGTGAVVEATYGAFYAKDRRTSKKQGGERNSATYGIYISKLRILNPGGGYVDPKFEFGDVSVTVKDVPFIRGPQDVTVNASSFPTGFINNEIPLTKDSKVRPTIVFTDSTGVGAKATPEFKDGRLVRVVVNQGGINYANPTLRIDGVSKPTREAKLKVTVGDAGDYPGTVAYFEQRRVFGGTPNRPQTIWMTRSGTDSDMTYTLPTRDDNRIKFRIAAQEASRIQHVVPLNKLIVLTTGTEFRVTSINSDAITPTSISVSPQSYIGASHVQPVLVNSSMIYAAARGGHIRELGYNWQANGYVTGDLSLRSAHLFETSRAVSIALQKAPEQIVWVAMSDGRLLGLTYLPDQGVGGWSTHDTVNGLFESITCVTEGEEDILYAVIRRRLRGEDVRTIERMGELNKRGIKESFYVDCGATYRGKPTTHISGLTWLEGEEVAVLADGATVPPQVVKDGAIDLPVEASVVHIGLPIEADMRTLPVAYQANDGSFGQGKSKNVGDVWVRVFESSGFKVGADFDNLIQAKTRKAEPMGTPPSLLSDEIQVYPKTSWGRTGQVCIRQDQPLPLTIVSVTWRLME